MSITLCLRCAAPNPPDENYCSKCGATLPKLAYNLGMPSVEQISERYMQFAQAVEYVKTGEWDLERFEAFLTEISEKLSKIEQDLEELPITEDIEEDFEEEMDVGFSGVELYNEGIDILMQYLTEEEPSLLDEGLMKIYQGNELINRARIINRERENKLGMAADMTRYEESMEL